MFARAVDPFLGHLRKISETKETYVVRNRALKTHSYSCWTQNEWIFLYNRNKQGLKLVLKNFFHVFLVCHGGAGTQTKQ